MWSTLGAKGLSNILVHATHAQDIHRITHLHEPIWGLVKDDNFYFNIPLQGVSGVGQKMVPLGTGLLHMKF